MRLRHALCWVVVLGWAAAAAAADAILLLPTERPGTYVLHRVPAGGGGGADPAPDPDRNPDPPPEPVPPVGPAPAPGTPEALGAAYRRALVEAAASAMESVPQEAQTTAELAAAVRNKFRRLAAEAFAPVAEELDRNVGTPTGIADGRKTAAAREFLRRVAAGVRGGGP